MPELVLLTEHWLRPLEPCDIPDYYIVSKFCRQNTTGYGGTIILINKHFSNNFYLQDIKRYDHLTVEGIFEFSIAFNEKINIYIVCVYRPPNGVVTEFLTNLELLLTLLPKDSKIILSGDLNINYEATNSPSTHALRNLLTSFGIKMLVKEPTRTTDSSATTIDYFCANFMEDEIKCRVTNVNFSDHDSVVAECPILVNFTTKIPKKMGRIYSRKNFDKFKRSCFEIDWNITLRSGDPVQEFHSLLKGSFDKSFPVCRMRQKNKKQLWISKGIRVSAKNLRCLCYLKKFTDNLNFIEYVNRYRSTYRRLIKAAKSLYYNNRIREAKNKSKECWNIVNDLRGKNSTQNKPIDMDPNIINDYFCTIAESLAAGLQSETDPIDYLKDTFIADDFLLLPTDIAEIRVVLRDIKNRNGAGIDDIPLSLFLNLDDRTLNVLAQAINKNFSTGNFPECLKTSIVVPLHKSGTHDNPANFRPISLLPTLSKIIEKIVKKRMLQFLNKHKILSKFQFGFQEGRGTNDAVFSFLEELYFKLNNQEYAAAVFCDFSKAFDCVNHELLLKKLHMYGFRGSVLRFFGSYLGWRKQMVRSGCRTSDPKPINQGVPQGSVLGPILFLLYINDLIKTNIQGLFTIFADDTTVLWHHKDTEVLKQIISEDMGKIKEWCNSNFLCFNIEKTKVLSFKLSISDIPLGDKVIKSTNTTKFLGIYIDDRLKFGDHITNLNRKLASGCYAVRQTVSALGFRMAKTTYFALIESFLRYGVAFWGCCSTTLLDSVFVLQKRAIRYLCEADVREHCKPLFLKHQILTLTCIFILETVCLIFEKFRNVVYAPSYNFRNQEIIPLPIPRSSLTKQSLIYDSIKIFNKLPSDCKRLHNIQTFRIAVKALLVDKAYYSLEEYFDDRF